MKGALKQQGFIGMGRSDTERTQWAEAEKEALSKIMLSHGIEWEQKGTHEKHKTVSEFKRDMLAKEIDELTEKKDDLLHTMSAYTKAEEYAHLTVQKIKDNDDFDIPEPPPLMSAKIYKTKFIEPFIKRIMQISKKEGKFAKHEFVGVCGYGRGRAWRKQAETATYCDL